MRQAVFEGNGYVQQPWGRFAEMFLGGIKGVGRREVKLELRGRVAGGVGGVWVAGRMGIGSGEAVLAFDNNKEM